MDHPKTLSAALCRIYTEVGAEVVKNPSKLPAVFLDIAPNLKTEQNLIQLLANSGCMKTLSAADTLPSAEVKNLVAVCVDSLCNYYSMDRQKAEELCNTYVKALNGVTYAGNPSRTVGNGAKTGSSVSGEGKGSVNVDSRMRSNGTSYHFGKFDIIQDANRAKVNTGSTVSGKSKESNPNRGGAMPKSGKAGGSAKQVKAEKSPKPTKAAKLNPAAKFSIKFFVLLLVYIATGVVSVGIDLATPTTNACLVTAAVAVVMIFCAHSKKK